MRLRRLVIASVLFITLWGGTVLPAWSSGIPTVDVAAIAQQLTSYVTQLQELGQLLAQTGLEQSQLAQMLIDYEQKLREYRSYLNQIRGFQRLISTQDWKRLMKIVVKSPFGQGIISKVPLLKPDDPDYREQVRDTLQEYGYFPDPTDEVANDLDDVGISGSNTAPFEAYNEDLEKSFSRYQDQLNMASANQRDSEERAETIDRYGDDLRGLGDESDLATLQMIATQDNFTMHQMEALIRAVTQNGLNYESPTTAQMQRKTKMLREEVARLKRVRERGGSKLSGVTSFAGPGF